MTPSMLRQAETLVTQRESSGMGPLLSCLLLQDSCRIVGVFTARWPRMNLSECN